MIVITLTTLLLLAAAIGWSLWLLWRERDVRLALLTLLLTAIAAHEAILHGDLLARPSAWSLDAPVASHDFVGLAVAGLALLALYVLQRLLSDRAETALALQRNEARIRQLFDATQDAILVTDSSGRYVDANPATEALLGYSRPELLSMKVEDIVAGRPAATRSPGLHGRGELTFVRADRQPRIGEFAAKRVAPDLHMVVVRDITEQKLAEHELRRSRHMVQSALDALAGHVAVVDDEGRIVVVNRAWRRFAADSGVPEDIYNPGAVYFDAWRLAAGAAPDGPESLRDAVGRVIAGGADRLELEYASQGAQRRWFTVHVSRFEVDGRVYAVISHEEITRLKVIQEALRKSEAEARRLADVAALTDNVTMIMDRHGRLEWVNEAFARATGRPAETLPGSPVASLLREAGPAAEGIEARLRGGRGFRTEVVIAGATGGERWYALDIRPMTDAAGNAVSFVGVGSDVTERRRVERDYRSLFELAGDAIIVFEPDQELVLDVNQRACELYGLSRQEFVGLSLQEISEDIPRGRERVAQLLETGRLQGLETVHRRADGSRMVLLINAAVIEFQGRRAVLSINRDITEARRAELELRASEQLNRRILENVPGGIVKVSADGAIVQTNSEARRFLGLSFDECSRTYIADFETTTIWEDGTPCPASAYPVTRCLATGEPQPPATIGVQHRDGTVSWGVFTAVPLLDPQTGRADGAVVTFLDISERLRTEGALRESERRFRAAAECASDLIYEIDSAVQRIDWFGDVDGALGYARGEFPRTVEGWLLAIHPDDRPMVETTIRAFMAERRPFGVEFRILRRNGEERRWSARAAPVLSDDGRAARWVGVTTDVTDLRELESQREQLLQRLRLQLDRMPLACVLFDTTMRIVDWNPAAERIFGYAKEEVLGRDAVELLVPPSARPYVDRILERIAGGDMSAHAVNENVTRDGRIITCEWSNTPLLDDQGRHIGLLSMVEDVTEKKLAQDRLRESERRYQTLAEVSPAMIFRADAGGAWMYVNERWAHVTGRGPAESHGRAWTGAVHPEDRERVESAWGGCVRRHDPFQQEFRLLRADGEAIWVIAQAQPERDAAGGVVGYVGALTDITARKRLELDLSMSEERYRRLVDSAPLAILVHQNGRFVYANERAVRFFGARTADDLLGTPAIDRVHPDFRRIVSDRMRQLRDGTDVPALHQKLLRLDGTAFDAEVAGSHCTFAGAPAVQIAGVDTTERRKLEEELRRAQKMEAVGQLASGVAHDFNNLLTAIFGFTGLAKRTLRENHPATRSLERVEEAARQAAGVTRALLTFARESPSSKQTVRLERVVEESLRLLRRTLPANIELRTQLAPGPLWVEADPTQIQQVVMNLAINARDAMPDGGTLRVVVDAEGAPARGADLSGSTVRLEVSDTGVGMTPDVLARLFEPFFTTKPPGEGTGLGLAIVHGIVQDHKGTIRVRSEPGKGAAFTVLLRGASPAAGASAPLAPTAVPAGQGGLIIVADGHQYIRELVSSMLTNLGYRVVQAADGETFLSVHERLGREANLLVLDTELAKRGGLECLRSLREAGDTTPAILTTGNASSLGPPAVDGRTTLLAKPFQLFDLAAAVQSALRRGTPNGDRN